MVHVIVNIISNKETAGGIVMKKTTIICCPACTVITWQLLSPIQKYQKGGTSEYFGSWTNDSIMGLRVGGSAT